jgi:alkyl sulfatase BDS1-like metallo-beta-lactamase superfamily hydrolase
MRQILLVSALALLAAFGLGSWQKDGAVAAEPKHFHPKGKPPSEHTIKILDAARATMPFSDKKDFEEQQRGFIAAP